jgi:hypothetical protein
MYMYVGISETPLSELGRGSLSWGVNTFVVWLCRMDTGPSLEELDSYRK